MDDVKPRLWILYHVDSILQGRCYRKFSKILDDCYKD